MIVYNLACEQNHSFEGWFGSPADFENQRDHGLVGCPICDSKSIERKLHAPRINTGGQDGASVTEKIDALADQANKAAIDSNIFKTKIRKLAEEIRNSTENVGERFAEEARAMHYGEKVQRNIRGRTSREEAQALSEEGIEFGALPFPVDFPERH